MPLVSMTKKDWIALFLCLLLPNLVGISAAFLTASGVTDWYPGLLKPLWTPPAWVFGPVWSTLYMMMGFGFYLVLRRGLSQYRRGAASLFALQLVFNFAWSLCFFGFKNPALAMADMVLLWLSIAATTWWFYKARPLAGVLLVPYLVWVTFAGCLNYFIWVLNR